jgi:hypothetical protein
LADLATQAELHLSKLNTATATESFRMQMTQLGTRLAVCPRVTAAVSECVCMYGVPVANLTSTVWFDRRCRSLCAQCGVPTRPATAHREPRPRAGSGAPGETCSARCRCDYKKRVAPHVPSRLGSSRWLSS